MSWLQTLRFPGLFLDQQTKVGIIIRDHNVDEAEICHVYKLPIFNYSNRNFWFRVIAKRHKANVVTNVWYSDETTIFRA